MKMKFSNSNGDFVLKLFKQVSKEGKSAFLSPASITAALAMTYAGAEGNTKHQMNELMFNGLNDQEINEGMQDMIKAINDPIDGHTLKTANRMYVEKSYQILQDFLNVIQKYHRSDCISADFISNAESSGREINNWVANATNNKIQNLIKPGVLNQLTRLVLVNAIYFKGDWKIEFQEKNTRKMAFHVSAENSIDVDMMHLTMKQFLYTQTEKCQVLGIPYKSFDLIMYFVLPTKRTGLHELEQELNGPELINLFQQALPTEVELDLPKFRLEQELSLNEPLQQMGCKDMFSLEDADFSRITGLRDLYVSTIVHKAFIEVNEKGAEAAAATASVLGLRCAPMKTIRFLADHPFLFAILERKTSTILFLGHYYG